jgi:hypothetical protein
VEVAFGHIRQLLRLATNATHLIGNNAGNICNIS